MHGSNGRDCGEESSCAYKLEGGMGTGWCWGGERGLELAWVVAMLGSVRFGDPKSLGRVSAH